MKHIIFFLVTICTISYANEGLPPVLPYLVLLPGKPISDQINAAVPHLAILNELDEAQYLDLSQMLSQFSSVKTLSLVNWENKNQIGWLLASITANENPVIFIRLEWGFKDIYEWECLNTILETSSLQFLSVEIIPEEHAKDILHLASGLEKTQSLKYFNSGMSDDHHVNEFLEMLAQNKSITEIILSETNLHDKSELVAAIANRNTALKTLSLSQCDITTEDQEKLLYELSHNTTLIQLNLYNNPCNKTAEEKSQIAIATPSGLKIHDDPTLDPYYSFLQNHRDVLQHIRNNPMPTSEQQYTSTNGSCNLL